MSLIVASDLTARELAVRVVHLGGRSRSCGGARCGGCGAGGVAAGG